MMARSLSVREIVQSWIVAKNVLKFAPSEGGWFSFTEYIECVAFSLADTVFKVSGFQQFFFVELEDSGSVGVVPNDRATNFGIIGIGEKDGSGMVVVADDDENGFLVIIAERTGIQIDVVQGGVRDYSAIFTVLKGPGFDNHTAGFQLAFEPDGSASAFQCSLALGG